MYFFEESNTDNKGINIKKGRIGYYKEIDNIDARTQLNMRALRKVPK